MKVNRVGDMISHPKLGPGVYRVTATKMAGGGTGHGPNDVYPDGHRLTLKLVGDTSAKPKRFYQTGCFVDEVMLPYCQPLES